MFSWQYFHHVTHDNNTRTCLVLKENKNIHKLLTSKSTGLTFDLPSDCFTLGDSAYDVAPLPTQNGMHSYW